MTNPVTPSPAPVPPSGGGMPKWVIVLIVVLLVVILGCCGGIGTCIYVVRRGAQTLKEKAPAWQAEMERRAQEAQRRAQEQQGGTPAMPGAPETPAGGENAGGGGAAAAPAREADNLPSTKLPSNFPSDVPIYSSLTPNYSMADNTKGAGTVMLTGNGNASDIAAWYEKQLSGKGWKEETNTTFNDATVLRYTKDNQHVGLTVTPSDGKVTVMIEYGKQ